jgi:hypothetical protein
MEQAEGRSAKLEELVREVLEPAGAMPALAEAIVVARLSALPEQPDALAHFLEGPLQESLVALLEQERARALIDELSERLTSTVGSGTRIRAPALTPDHTIDTLPPPAPLQPSDGYEDLATGAVHTRPTPTWGLRRGGEPEKAVWLIVSNDADLLDRTRRTAPAGTDVVAVSSMAVLKGALARSEMTASRIVFDARDPSIPLDRAIAALTEETPPSRVVLWRMEDAARNRLTDALPMTRTWLAIDADVTAIEIAQLLALGA